jgi:hypothetical protein
VTSAAEGHSACSQESSVLYDDAEVECAVIDTGASRRRPEVCGTWLKAKGDSATASTGAHACRHRLAQQVLKAGHSVIGHKELQLRAGLKRLSQGVGGMGCMRS